ncbi:hypothetical protein JOC94_000849 [Bacillus thermophilus]|uniref:Uncharacterized protein n=1 Tax=Siminovitchia thermophila TaxID=1245522 RepID=A0ABS2R2S1_9BACI|nr:hypothetical protein [Siminovitchia thermophila]
MKCVTSLFELFYLSARHPFTVLLWAKTILLTCWLHGVVRVPDVTNGALSL